MKKIPSLMCILFFLSGLMIAHGNPFGEAELEEESSTAPAAPAREEMHVLPQATDDAEPTADKLIPTAPMVEESVDPDQLEVPEDFVHDRSPRVAVLGYHRFSHRRGDALNTTSAELREHINRIRAAGMTIISMDQFIAWKQGKANIPDKSMLITIDDGFRSIYDVAWPIFRELDVPFTVFIYTQYVGNGRDALTWPMLQEMADAGVEIGSHTISHKDLCGKEVEREFDLTQPPRRRLIPAAGVYIKGALLHGGLEDKSLRTPYENWVWQELVESRQILEEKLGQPVRTLSYPYGIFSNEVAAMAEAAGYEAMFTVNGDEINMLTPATELHRYIIQSDDISRFENALKFPEVGATPQGDPARLPDGFTVTPEKNEVAPSRRPQIEIQIAETLEVDPESFVLRLSGLGRVDPVWDAVTRTVSFQPVTELRNETHTVMLSYREGGEMKYTRWSFRLPPREVN